MQRIDTDTVQELIDSHGAALTLYAREWCNSPEDALQEALIELLKQQPAPDQPVAWLFSTIRRRALNLTRGERRRSEHHRRAGEGREQWFSDDNVLGFDGDELAQALSLLNDIEREVVIARIWGELSFERIGELVGTSSSSAHRQYHKALLQLHEILDGSDQNVGRSNESETQTPHRCDA